LVTWLESPTNGNLVAMMRRKARGGGGGGCPRGSGAMATVRPECPRCLERVVKEVRRIQAEQAADKAREQEIDRKQLPRCVTKLLGPIPSFLMVHLALASSAQRETRAQL
jgi:hypothetical protein